MKKHTSQSEIKTFQSCKRKWFYGYIRRLREIKYTPNALSQGTFYHEGVEHIHDNWEAHLDAMLERELAKVDPLFHGDLQEQIELAKLWVAGFIEWSEQVGLYADVDLIAREQQLAIDFGDWVLMCKLDEVVMETNGELVIRDHKTAADFSIFNLAQYDLQLPTYIMAYNKSDLPGHALSGEWVVTKKNKRTARAKGPFYDKHKVTYKPSKMEATRALWESVMNTILGLEKAWSIGNFSQDQLFPPSFSRDCSWCAYNGLCTMKDDGSRIEDYISEWFEVSDPFERYNNVEISNKEKA